MLLPVFSSLALLLTPSVRAVDPLVNLTYASYRGKTLDNGVSQWLGVPYAAPPLAHLRFAAPRDVNIENKEYQATSVSAQMALYTSPLLRLLPSPC